MHVVICGAGVIGGALAYELSKRGASVTIIERWKVGGCASGKSGGFLAQDWCDGTPVSDLAHRSFALHQEWADALGNSYGYRRVDTFGTAMSVRRSLGSRGQTDLAEWLADDAVHRRRLGTPSTTAQLDPEAFTKALVDGAVAHGAELRFGAVAGLLKSGDGSVVRGVQLEDGTQVEGDAIVLALGPWSLLAAQWLPLPPIYGLKGHSIIFRPAKPLPAETIFAEFEDTDGEHLAPEIVPRMDGTLYVCGLSGDDALPVDPSRVLPEDGGCERLRRVTVSLVPQLADADIIAEQACFRPVTADGMPLIGPIDGYDGAYVATGHSVWGMLNAPGTAEALTDLLLDSGLGSGRTGVDLAPFSPSRLSPLDPSDLELHAN